MNRDQFNGDDPRNIRPEWRAGQANDGPYIVRVRLTAALASGGSAAAKVVDYGGASLAVSNRVITVHDSMRLKSGASGDYFWAMWNVDARRWEVLGDSGEKVLFRNDDATEAPAYANMQIADPGVATIDGVKYLQVIKCDGDYSIAKPVMLLNGGSAVASGATGTGYLAHEIPRRVKYKTADGTPAFGEVWGTYNTNEWEARKGVPGYLVLGNPSDGSFLGIKDTEVRAVGAIYKTGSITETTAGKNPVELAIRGSQFNTDIDESAGNYKITILIAGSYHVTAHMSVQNDYSIGPKYKRFSMSVIRNAGATSIAGAMSANCSTWETAKANMAVSGIFPLEVGDYLQMTFTQDDTTDQSKTLYAALNVVRVF